MASSQRIKETLTSIPTLNQLCIQVLNDEYSSSASPSSFSRSLLWKLTCTGVNCNSNADFPLIKLLDVAVSSLNYERKQYAVLCSDFKIPWFELSKDSKFYQQFKASEQELDIADIHQRKGNGSPKSAIKFSKRRATSPLAGSTEVVHDPLSANHDISRHNSSPLSRVGSSRYMINPELTKSVHKETDIQILESIINDVERLFPENENLFINNVHHQRELIEIIYLWVKLTRISYHQGLHELFGMMYITLQQDSIDPKSNAVTQISSRMGVVDNVDSNIVELMDSNFVKEDTFTLIQKLIYGVLERFYVEDNLISEFIKFELKFKMIDSLTYNILKKRFNINFNIWLIRYFKLLLTREIGIPNSLNLWDKLIAFNHLNNLSASSIPESRSSAIPKAASQVYKHHETPASRGLQRARSSSTVNLAGMSNDQESFLHAPAPLVHRMSDKEKIGEVDLCLLIPYLTILLVSKIKERLVTAEDMSEGLFLLLHYPIKEPEFPGTMASKQSGERTFSSSRSRKFNSPAIFLSSDDDGEETSASGTERQSSDVEGFVYIEPNHHTLHNMASKQKLSSESSLSVNLAKKLSLESNHSGSTTDFEDDEDDENELVELDIGEMCRVAVQLFYMNDKELESTGAKLVDSFSRSGHHHHHHKKNSQKKSANDSTISLGMIKRTASWSLRKKKSEVKKLSLGYFIDERDVHLIEGTGMSSSPRKADIQLKLSLSGDISSTTTLKSSNGTILSQSPQKKDFNRTRLEKRLQKIVR
ncbi:unnamed protein product [Ambrosiozyma monospora]|uniref:Unnamed protein product n=1 Tax=Ambrosiozyma monospora TaxID=43982 RepID=A0ACB5SS81_AMBMO|nr:unnamed protein product [Ambrosiozyma monospora]